MTKLIYLYNNNVTDNNLGGWYSYRMSKAALNMATKNVSIELGRGKSKVICVALHPGKLLINLRFIVHIFLYSFHMIFRHRRY